MRRRWSPTSAGRACCRSSNAICLRARTVIVCMQTRRLPTDTPLLHWHRFERVLEWDRACAVLLNSRLSPSYEKLWITIDRLGDSGPWIAFIAIVALLGGPQGLRCAAHMLAVGVLAVVVYKLVKNCAGRPRPCVRIENVRNCIE